MKILAIPGNTNKKYSFELMELLQNYQNEVVSFLEGNRVPNVKFFSLMKRLKDPFLFENELIANKLRKILFNSRFDYIWNLGINRECLPYITRESARQDIKLIQTISDDTLLFEREDFISPKNYKLDKIIKFYAPDVDLFFVHSQFLKNLLLQNGVVESKISHIPFFVDSSKYTASYKSENYFVYNYSSEAPSKIKLLLDTMKKLPQHKLIITSKKEFEGKIKLILKDYAPDNVLIVDNFDEAYKKNLLKMARFSLVLSDIKPQKILENYATGKPVLAIKSGSNEEYVVNTYSGLLFNSDTEELAHKINYLMTNPDFCAESGQFARSLIENCFDKKTHYSKVFNAINKIPEKTGSKLNEKSFLNIS